MMELSEDVIKLILIFIVIACVLAIYSLFVSNELQVFIEKTKRESVILGNLLLSSNCLTDGKKSLFLEEKLDSFDSSCINYPFGSAIIELLDESKKWEIDIGEIRITQSGTYFVVAVKLRSGVIKPAQMEVIA